ncbi:MAG: hypothetical protein ACKO5C_06465 [Ferruginibacter sp.]
MIHGMHGIRSALACFFVFACSSITVYAQCEHQDYFSSWERIKANNSAGVTTSYDYVMYRIKRCTMNRPNAGQFTNLGVCHPTAHIQVKAPDGMPADPKTGEVTAGYLVLDFIGLNEPVEVLFTVPGPGQIFDNDVVQLHKPNLRSIKMLLMDDVLARLGKGNPAVRSGTAEKAIEFPGAQQSSKSPAGNQQGTTPASPPAPSILFREKQSQPTASNTVAALSKKMPDMDDFMVEKTNQTALPTKPSGVVEFLKKGMWSDARSQIDTSVYELVPLDDQGNFLMIDKARMKSDESDKDRIRYFYPGVSYPSMMIRQRFMIRRYRPAVMGVRG